MGKAPPPFSMCLWKECLCECPYLLGSHSCKKGWDTKRPKQPEVVSIVDLAEKAKVDSFRNYQDKVIGVVGYVADEQRYDHANKTVKYLLYSDYDKRGKFPAVMLFFSEALWPIEVRFLTGLDRVGVWSCGTAEGVGVWSCGTAKG